MLEKEQDIDFYIRAITAMRKTKALSEDDLRKSLEELRKDEEKWYEIVGAVEGWLLETHEGKVFRINESLLKAELTVQKGPNS